MTCLRLDWRTYKKACRDRWAAVTLDAAVSENTRLLLGSGMVVRDGQGTVPASGGRRAGQAGVRPVVALRQAVTPLLVSTPRPSGNASARACSAAWRSCS